MSGMKRTSLAAVLILPVVMAGVLFLAQTVQLPEGCTMQKYFQLPCPLCGGQRCVRELLRFHFADALRLHAPLVGLLLSLGVGWFIGLSALLGSRPGARSIAWFDAHRVLLLVGGSAAFASAGFLWRLLFAGCG